jgi:hypothetical protein
VAALLPLSAQERHPADYRGDAEHAEIARILSELPDRHPARVAYATGAWEGANTLSLSRLVAQRMDLVERLIEVYSGHAAEARVRVPEL